MSEEGQFCLNHPRRETMLRCGKCERPFCTECLVHTPVGLRCRECAQFRRSPLYVLSPTQVALALVAGLAAGLGLGLLLFGLPVVRAFALWLSPFYGIGVAEAISVAAKRRRGPALLAILVVSVLFGAVFGKYGLEVLSLAGWVGPGAAFLAAAERAGRDLFLMLFVAVAVLVGQTRVR